MELFRFIISAICLALGVLVFFIGTFGIYRFKFVLNRMHSAALLDTMGLLFIILSLIIARGFSAISIKLLLVVAFLWLTSPISSHLIAKMEFFTDKNLKEEITNDLDKIKEGEDENVSNDI